jgi:hypothetical protein
MPKLVNLPDFIKVGLMAYAFIWIANRGLDRVGLSEFMTKS